MSVNLQVTGSGKKFDSSWNLLLQYGLMTCMSASSEVQSTA